MGKHHRNYDDPETLYLGLLNGENGAILYLHQKTTELLRSWQRTRQLAAMDLEEIAEDAVVLTLRKIETGGFVFDGTSPCAFANRTARNLLHNHFRKHRIATVEIQEWDALESPTVEKYLRDKEIQTLLADALAKLSENCRQLITLFHLEEKTDEETLREGLIPHNSVRSLASSRSECMKKLRLVMAEFKKHL